jgi:hypothetical protein
MATHPEPPKKSVFDLDGVASMGEVWEATKDYSWVAKGFIPRPGVVMVSGPKSSLKTFTLISVGVGCSYGLDWPPFDTKLPKGLVMYVAGENVDELPIRHRACLRAFNLIGPDAGERIDDDFLAGVVESDNLIGAGVRLDLANAEHMAKLTTRFQAISERRGKPVIMVVFDTVTSLITKTLSDIPTCKAIVANTQLMATKLYCGIVLVNHTHLNNPNKSQGAFPLGAGLHGDFLAARNKEHETNGQKLGLRTVVTASRMKRMADLSLAFDFHGVPITLGVGGDGQPLETLAMRCVGLTTANQGIDQNAVRRYELAKALEPGKAVSASKAQEIVGWGHGGNQKQWLENCLPLMNQVYTVHLGPEAGTEQQWRELERYPRGSYTMVACRFGKEPIQTEEKKPDRGQDEAEIRRAKEQAKTGKRTNKRGAGRPLSAMPRGLMQALDYMEGLDAPLGADNRFLEFVGQVEAMREKGCGPLDEALMTYIRAAKDNVTLSPRLFAKAQTVREIIQQAQRMMKAATQKNARKTKRSEDTEGDSPV